METSTVGLGLAFVAGLASFLSPCVFSLMPAYIGYLGGRTAASAQGGVANRWVILSHALAFVLGFSLIFTSLGLGASVLGSVLREITPLPHPHWRGSGAGLWRPHDRTDPHPLFGI